MKQAFVRKSWENESRKALKSKKDQKNIYQVIVRSGRNSIESDLNIKPKTTVLSKNETSFADSIFIHTTDESDVIAASSKKDVIAVIRKPKMVPMGFTGEIRGEPAYFPSLLQTCNVNQTKTQAGIVDSVGNSTINVNGKGTLIIVWDFVPGESSSLSISEFTEREGGGMYFYRNGSNAIASHGAQVASIAAGKSAGLAKGAALALLGLSDDIFQDLSIIESLIEAFKGPVLINMSFGLEWENVNNQIEIDNINRFMQFASEAVSDIKLRYPKTLFFIAAGNETQNMCDTLGTLTYSIGNTTKTKMVIWPQFERNKSSPFVSVGATTVRQEPPTRKISIYSNYGDCINFFAHGGPICGWDTDFSSFKATQGTSFSCPIAVSIASLLFSAYPSKSASEILDIMNSSATDSVTGQYSGDTTSKFLQLPATLNRETAAGPPKNNDLPGDILSGSVELEDNKNSPLNEARDEFKIPLIITGVIILILLLLLSFQFFVKRNNSNKI